VAAERDEPGAGADEYRLRLPATGEEMARAVRDHTLSPPYRFAAATVARLERWATVLPAGSPLVVLDEVSRFEARGEGLDAAVARDRRGAVNYHLRELVPPATSERSSPRTAGSSPSADPRRNRSG
jgi:hypothetical protein